MIVISPTVNVKSNYEGFAVAMAIAVTTAINIEGEGREGERLVYYCTEIDLCTPSPRDHPSGGVIPYWPVGGGGEALPHPDPPASRD